MQTHTHSDTLYIDYSDRVVNGHILRSLINDASSSHFGHTIII